jgi:hypothetical protein
MVGLECSSGLPALERDQPVLEIDVSKPKPPVSLLWEKYSFNPLTGRFHSLHGSHMKQPGEVIQGNMVGFMRGRLASHQLSISSQYRYPYGVCVFAWVHGRWPEDGIHIDHINHDPFDHRPFNLRELPALENSLRRRAHRRPAGSPPLPGRRHSPQFSRSAKAHSLVQSEEVHSIIQSGKAHSLVQSEEVHSSPPVNEWATSAWFLACSPRSRAAITGWHDRRSQAMLLNKSQILR